MVVGFQKARQELAELVRLARESGALPPSDVDAATWSMDSFFIARDEKPEMHAFTISSSLFDKKSSSYRHWSLPGSKYSRAIPSIQRVSPQIRCLSTRSSCFVDKRRRGERERFSDMMSPMSPAWVKKPPYVQEKESRPSFAFLLGEFTEESNRFVVSYLSLSLLDCLFKRIYLSLHWCVSSGWALEILMTWGGAGVSSEIFMGFFDEKKEKRRTFLFPSLFSPRQGSKTSSQLAACRGLACMRTPMQRDVNNGLIGWQETSLYLCRRMPYLVFLELNGEGGM